GCSSRCTTSSCSRWHPVRSRPSRSSCASTWPRQPSSRSRSTSPSVTAAPGTRLPTELPGVGASVGPVGEEDRRAGYVAATHRPPPAPHLLVALLPLRLDDVVHDEA